MQVKDIKLNLVPFGHRGKDKKEEFFPEQWKQYQTKMCEKKIGIDDNVVLITGRVPGTDYQVVVLDFDGHLGMDDFYSITAVFGSKKDDFLTKFCCSQETGNCGLHFLYLCDNEVEIRNVQDRVLKPLVFNNRVKKVDVRGNGGFVFWNSTEFSDSEQPYHLIGYNGGFIVSSKSMQTYIESLYTKPLPKHVIPAMMEDIIEDVRILVDDRIKPLRYPLRRLIMKGAPEIEELSQQSGEIEELYWKALWLEVLNKGVPVELVKRLLARYQEHYDEAVTDHQLGYLYDENKGGLWKPFKNDTLERMFPGWKAPRKKPNFEEWKTV